MQELLLLLCRTWVTHSLRCGPQGSFSDPSSGEIYQVETHTLLDRLVMQHGLCVRLQLSCTSDLGGSAARQALESPLEIHDRTLPHLVDVGPDDKPPHARAAEDNDEKLLKHITVLDIDSANAQETHHHPEEDPVVGVGFAVGHEGS